MTRAQRYEAVLRAVQRSKQPYYITCRVYGVSPATVVAWRDYGFLPKRADARMRLAEFLKIPLQELEHDSEHE